MTRVSELMPRSVSSASAFSIVGRSLLEPITMPTRGASVSSSSISAAVSASGARAPAGTTTASGSGSGAAPVSATAGGWLHLVGAHRARPGGDVAPHLASGKFDHHG